MSDTATAQIKIDIVASGATNGATQVNRALDSIEKRGRSAAAANDNLASTFEHIGKSMGGAGKAGDVLGSIFEGIGKKALGAAEGAGELLGSLARFGPQAAVIAAVGVAIAAIGTKAIEAASEVEQWKANLVTMTGSAQKANESYKALVNFAKATPFDLSQSVEGFIKLRALGIQATEKAMTSFGNTASAFGKPLKQMIEAVADASTMEFERLKEFGIKAKQSKDTVAFTFQGTTEIVKKNSQDITAYLEKIGNTKFAGEMDRQMDTIKGAASNVEDSLFQMFAAIGGGKLGAAVKEILGAVSNGITNLTPLFASIGNWLGSILEAGWKIGSSLASVFVSIGTGGQGVQPVLDGLTVAFNLIAEGVEVAGDIISAVFGAAANTFNAVAGVLRETFGAAFDWLIPNFASTGQSAVESFVGILRGAKYVAESLPKLFSIALADVFNMFKNLGLLWDRLIHGDLSAIKDVPTAITASFARSGKAMDDVMKGASAIQRNQKANRAAIQHLLGRDDTKAKLDTGPLTDPQNPAGKPKKDREAERRAKQEKEFWTALQGEVDTAKLLPLAAEDYKKQLELQKILGRDLNKGEVDRIHSLMEQARTQKFITDALNSHNNAVMSMNAQEQEYRNKLAGMTDEQQATEKAILDFRMAALQKGVDLTSAAYQASENQLRVDQTRLGVLNAQNKALDSALESAKTYSDTFGQWKDAKDLGDKRKDFLSTYDAAVKNGSADKIGLTPKVRDEVLVGMDKASTQASLHFYDQFSSKIDDIGQEFGGKIGKAIQGFASMISSMTKAATGDFSGMGKVGSVLTLFGKKSDGSLNTFGQAAADANKGMLDKMFSSDTWSKPFTSMSSSFKDLKSTFTDGGFAKGMGKALGQAGVGVQIGDSVQSVLAPLGKALGVKTSKTGAEIGGALGSAFGPVGSVIGSIGGSIIGGLFKKAPKGGSTITLDQYGQLAIGSTFGNNKNAKNASIEGANGVISGLSNIAQALGATISGNPNITIGTYKGKWRVNTGGTQLKGGGSQADTLTNFGKDGEADAIAFAIKAALQQGVITGISAFSQKVLQSGMDTDAALNVATSWEKVLKSLESWQDPVKYAVESVTKSFDTLQKSMETAGASADDLAKLQTERAKELADALKQLTSPFQDLLDTINGASGKSSLQLLNEEMAQFASFQSDISAGKSIDSSDYSDLVNKILQNAGDVYGSNSSQYQGIIGQLRDTTNGAIGSITTQFNSAAGTDTVSAITSAASSQAASSAITNDYLSQINTGIATLTATLKNSGSVVGNVNGVAIRQY